MLNIRSYPNMDELNDFISGRTILKTIGGRCEQKKFVHTQNVACSTVNRGWK